MNRKERTLLNSYRGRALLHALTLEAVSGPKVFQRAGLRDAKDSDGWHQNYRVLSTLVNLGLVSKTGPRQCPVVCPDPRRPGPVRRHPQTRYLAFRPRLSPVRTCGRPLERLPAARGDFKCLT